MQRFPSHQPFAAWRDGSSTSTLGNASSRSASRTVRGISSDKGFVGGAGGDDSMKGHSSSMGAGYIPDRNVLDGVAHGRQGALDKSRSFAAPSTSTGPGMASSTLSSAASLQGISQGVDGPGLVGASGSSSLQGLSGDLSPNTPGDSGGTDNKSNDNYLRRHPFDRKLENISAAASQKDMSAYGINKSRILLQIDEVRQRQVSLFKNQMAVEFHLDGNGPDEKNDKHQEQDSDVYLYSEKFQKRFKNAEKSQSSKAADRSQGTFQEAEKSKAEEKNLDTIRGMLESMTTQIKSVNDLSTENKMPSNPGFNKFDADAQKEAK